MLNSFGRRYVDARAFQSEIRRLRIYRAYVGEHLLERLERAQLVIPKLRMRYPDPIARRWWHDTHPEYGRMVGPLEPDGPRYTAANDLAEALERRQHQDMYGRCAHPLDDLDPRFAEFVHRPAERAFVNWSDFRVDVSNEKCTPLWDDGATTTLYSCWQLLLAAEVADIGVHYMINLANRDIYQTTLAAIRSRQPIRAESSTLYFEPVEVAHGFSRHERALDAVVWFVEETSEAIGFIAKYRGGRFRLNEAEAAQYAAERTNAARDAAARYEIDFDEVLQVIGFLTERLAQWNHDGRQLIAEQYKSYIGYAVLMARIIGERSYDEVRGLIGSRGGYFRPILDEIFPDWREAEKDRARRTLKAMTRDPIGPKLEVTDNDVDAFVDFLDTKNLHSFFWRLRSCEDHVFRGNEFSVRGMQSDVQAMAVVVERIMRALGGRRDKLHELFKELWVGSTVERLLKKNHQLVRSRVKAHEWSAFMGKVDAFRQQDSEHGIIADLVLASRIRGAVHDELPEEDPWALEELLAALIRAAVLSFAHVRRVKP